MKLPSNKFNIFDHVEFASGLTRSAGLKLRHKTASTNSVMNSYFYHIPDYGTAYIPIIDLSYSLPNIKFKLKNYFGIILLITLTVIIPLFLLQVYENSCSYKLFYSLTYILYPFYPLYVTVSCK